MLTREILLSHSVVFFLFIIYARTRKEKILEKKDNKPIDLLLKLLYTTNMDAEIHIDGARINL